MSLLHNVNSEPRLDSLEWPRGSWKGHCVLQQADGVEEDEGSNSHSSGTCPPLWAHTTPNVPFNPQTESVKWFNWGSEAHHQSTRRSSCHMTAKREWASNGGAGVGASVWAGPALLSPVGEHRGSKRAQLYCINRICSQKTCRFKATLHSCTSPWKQDSI